MAIIKTLFGISEGQKRTRQIEAKFEEFQSHLANRINKQNHVLANAGLPVPRQIGSVGYQITEWENSRDSGRMPAIILINMPTFEVPEYFAFCIQEDFWMVIPKDDDNSNAVYSPSNVTGLADLAQLPHACLTAHPYSFYEAISGKTGTVSRHWHDITEWLYRCYVMTKQYESLDFYAERPMPALLQQLTVAEALNIHFRASLLNDLTDYRFANYADERLYKEGGFASKVRKEILLDLPLQMPFYYPDINLDTFTNLKVLPAGEIKPALMADFWESLRPLNCLIVFELIAERGSTYFRLAFPAQHTAFVQRALERYFPKYAAIEDHAFELGQGFEVRACHTMTNYSYQYPIKRLSQFSVDPYSNIAHIFERSRNGLACIQVLLQPIPADQLNMLTWGIKQFFPRGEDKEAEQLARPLQKKWPLWAVGLSSITVGKKTRDELLPQFCTEFAEGKQSINHWHGSMHTVFPRSTPRYNFLDTDELAALAHFPISPLSLPSLETTSMKATLPPELFRTGEVKIGESEVRGQRVPVTLPDSVRDRHVYIVGKTRMGKSTLITNIALSDIDRGAGVCVIDPHGDLVEDLLNTIPEHRAADTIYFNANDKEHPIALNVLQAKNEDEVALLADNLHVTFRRLSESWGQRMDDILRATLQTLASTPGSTFVDIKKMLQDPAFRGRVTANLDHPMLRDFWQLDFAAYPKDAPTPIISRVNRFLYAPHFYRMFSETKNALSISDVVEKQKILLVNLASGAIGDDNATVLGSLLVSQIQQAVMRRAGLPKHARTPYYLFVDEFQNFTNSAFDKILSEAGKYNLCLTLAHQFISQLADNQRDAIFGNVGTMIMFGVGDKDASYLRNQIGSFEPDDLLNMPPHQALCRPATRAADTFHFKTTPPPQGRQSYASAIIANTHSRYSLTSTRQKIDAPESVTETETPMQAPPKESRRIGFSAPPKAAAPVQPVSASVPLEQLQPALALPKEFGSTAEKILYYVEMAEYLSTQQIIALCYGHQSESSRKANASRDLGKLTDNKQIKAQPFGSGKIYTSARLINPTMHNLSVRDLLVKILLSRYEVAGVNLKPTLPSHNPDLEVSFLAETGELIKTFWEYDAGTEGIEVLRKKLDYYSPYAKSAIISFVFNSEARWRQVARGVTQNGNGWVRLGVLSEFNSLDDHAFTIHGESSAQPFFGYF